MEVTMESTGGALVRVLACHQCGPGSSPGVDATCGLSLLLVLSLAPRCFSPSIPVFLYPQTNISKFKFGLECTDTFLRTPRCFVLRYSATREG